MKARKMSSHAVNGCAFIVKIPIFLYIHKVKNTLKEQTRYENEHACFSKINIWLYQM